MVVSHILQDHNPWLLILAIAICFVGSASGILLWNRALHGKGRSRHEWALLSALVLGATVWTTHFLSMLGYSGSAMASFDVRLTGLSVAAAVVGVYLAVLTTQFVRNLPGHLTAGTILGLGIATMHTVGMAGFQVGMPVGWKDLWSPDAALIGIALCIVSVRLLHFEEETQTVPRGATLSFTLAVAEVHFTAMSAFHERLGVIADPSASAEHVGLAIAVALVTVPLIGLGAMLHLTQLRHAKSATEELKRNARTDGLTGVLNRDGFNEALLRQCANFDAGGEGFALFFIDLDRFKPVNDAYGHHVGDMVLQRVVERLRAVVRSTDMVARLGGDEFAIILIDIEANSAAADRVADRVIDLIARPFLIETRIIEIGASIGIAEPTPSSKNDPVTLCRNADMALYSAKARGRKTWCRFASDIAKRFEDRVQLECDLRKAMARGEFELFFQPFVDSRTREIVGAEALLRWRHPARGLLPPPVFISLADEIGIVRQIGKWIVETACDTAMRWDEPLRVAVNISPTQLRETRIVQTVRDALRASGLPPDRLELEVTEGALEDNEERAKHMLKQLHHLGVTLALDDFGTGVSSLSQLQKLPLDRIKIDRTLIASLYEDEQSAKLVEAISQTGGILGLGVTAEGIEGEDQLIKATRLGCDILQGFFISEPVSGSAIEVLLSEAREERSGRARAQA